MVRTACAVIVVGISLFSSAAFSKPNPPPAPPVVITTPRFTPENYGDWQIVRLTQTAYMAGVKNSSGLTFGTICNSSGCTAFFDVKIPCANDAKYPSLINAPSSAFPATLLCEKVDNFTIYSTELEGNIADAMSVGGVLGIAFPMESGEFRVARFSLTGAARATARASQLAKSRETSSQKGRGDSYSL